MNSKLEDEGLIRGKRIYGEGGLIPVSRSAWYEGIAQGRYPPPLKIGARSVAWRKSDLRALLAHLDTVSSPVRSTTKPRD